MSNFFALKKTTKFCAVFLFASLMSLIAGCADNTGATTPASTTPTASSVQLWVSSPEMQSKANATTLLTAVVLDAGGQAMVAQAVTFTRADTAAYFSQVSLVTDKTGVATATLNIGNNLSGRVIPIAVSSAGASGANTVTVTGTSIAIGGNTSVALNATTVLTIVVKDSSGAVISGVPIAITSKNGNPVSLSSQTTTLTGQVTATVIANNVGTGTDILTVTSAGAVKEQTLTINSSNFNFTAPLPIAPAVNPEVLVNTATTVSVLWKNGGVAVPDGTLVTFNTSRGYIANTSALLASKQVTTLSPTVGGVATASFIADSTGVTKINASGASGTIAAVLNVEMVTNQATTVDAQVSPATVAVNVLGTTSDNQSVISVLVRDANKNLVKNAHVLFTQVVDPSGGQLISSDAITDITGSASVNYKAGTTTSSQNGVQIKITLDRVGNVQLVTPLTTTVLLTVASQNLFVRMGDSNSILVDPITYTPLLTAVVSDSGGNPAANDTSVRFVLRPAALSKPAFFKGYWRKVVAVPPWERVQTAACPNEDTNLDGVLQPSEDTNGNGILDPSGVAVVNTNAPTVGGFAIAKVSYAKEFATWVQMDLEARAGTVANDPPSVYTMRLPMFSEDIKDATKPPPGLNSPYGIGSSCADTN
jgi:hypothetical protein